MSSGEAEFYAAGKAAVEAIGMRSLLDDLGWEAGVRVHVDASAAKAMASRQGIGKVRHLEVRFLWLQEMVKQGRVKLAKVWGKANPADALTKPMSHLDMCSVLRLVDLHDA